MGGPPDCSASNMLSSEEPGVYGPRARPNHCQSAAEDRQHERHPDIARAHENNPELDDYDQCSGHWGPKPCKEEQSQDSSGELHDNWATRMGLAECCNPLIEQSDSRDQSLYEKAEARPTVCKRCK
jgi:hypothetical protein